MNRGIPEHCHVAFEAHPTIKTIHMLLKLEGRSWRWLAEESRVNRSTLQRYRMGRAMPRADHLDRLLKPLGRNLVVAANGGHMESIRY